MNPIIEKAFIATFAVFGIWGLIYLLTTFPTPGIIYVAASVVGAIVVTGLVVIFTRSPA